MGCKKYQLPPITATTKLTFAGPYQYSRNPVYLSLALLYLAVTLWLNNLWLIILFIPIMFCIWWAVSDAQKCIRKGYLANNTAAIKTGASLAVALHLILILQDA
ncbi:methyltransferase [Psychromonas sp.]|uniref:methyltransferase n=1 Tax=Psychromonas sp. TaxID=1884585 RepID=UPI003566C452